MVIFYFLLSALLIMCALLFVLILNKNSKINKIEIKILELFYAKINKIPALVELIRKEVENEKAYHEIIHLHSESLRLKFEAFYDLLEINARIHKEFLFLMNLSIRQPDLATDGNFIYLRDFIIFYEKNITKEIEKINTEIQKHNGLITLKNYTIF